MENCRKSIFPLLGMVFLIAFSVSVWAQTGEEVQTEVKKDEVVQAPEVPETLSAPSSLEAQPAVTEQATQPVAVQEPTAQEVPVVQPLAVQETVAQEMPAAQSVVVQESAAQEMPVAQPEAAQEPVVPTKSVAQVAPAVTGEIITPIPNPSGVLEVSGYKYPVYLYAPKDYKTDRTYSLILMAPAESVKAQEQIAYLTGLAQRRSIFILSPHVLWPKPGDTPYELDKWLFEVKKDIVERFPINKKRIYLVGKNSGAHYAAYLATKHPQEFSAVALFGEAWDGPFSQLIKPSSDPVKQVPFYIALKTGSNAKERNQVWFDKLQKKGYVLYLTEYPKEETLDELEFKKAAYEWLEEASQSWISEVARRHQGWKGQLKKGVRDFFTV